MPLCCIKSVCLCVISPLYLNDLEMHLLLNSVLFNKKAAMPRVAIRKSALGAGMWVKSVVKS